MNKRIISLLLCFVMVFAMLATAVPVFAIADKTVTVTPDKIEANPDDTVTYIVTFGAVPDVAVIQFNLLLPEQLEFVSGSGKVTEGLATAHGINIAFGELCGFTESSLLFEYVDLETTDFTETQLMTFQCKVKESATLGDAVISLKNLTVYNDSDQVPVTYDSNTSKVTVKAKPVPATGITLDKTTLSLTTGGTAKLTATVSPNNSTDTVVWSSSNELVATVDQSGNVTAASSIAPDKTKTATITATAGTQTATCTVTVNCAHSYTAQTKSNATLKTAGTCTDKAVYYYSCVHCGEVENSASHTFEGDKDANNHGINSTHLQGDSPATCEAAGYTGDVFCNGCNQKISDGEPIPKKAHTTGAWVSDPNKHWKLCSDCSNKIDEADHTWQWVIDLAATEETEGVKHKKCTVCDEVTETGTPIQKLDHTHNLTHFNAVASTCTTQGNIAYYHCTKCNKNYEDATGLVEIADVSAPLAAHQYTVPQNDANQHWNKCANCTATDTKVDHDFTGAYLHDDNQHWHKCAGCDAIDTKADHIFDNDEDMICDTCGYDKTHICHVSPVAEIPATEDATGVMAHYKCECGKLYLDDTCSAEVEEADLVIRKLPKMLEGKNSKWTKGSNDGLTFRSDADFAELEKVMVDNADLAADKYDEAEGSTVITLKPEYLETLAVGNHTISIVSENGVANADFTIEAAAVPGEDTPAQPGTTSPQTGDTSNIFLWVALMFVAGAGVIGTTVVGKKKRVR